MRLVRTRSVALGAALALSAGCVAPAPARPARHALPIEEHPAPGTAAPVDTTSTAALGTAVVAIDLATVLELAGAKPNAIRLARERLAEAEARVDASGAALLPSLALGPRFERHNGTIQDVSGPFLDTTRQAIFTGGTGELVLDVGGNVLSFLRERQRRDVASAELDSATQRTGLAAALGYFELVGAESASAIARDALDRAAGFLAVAASREKNALGLPLDTIRARAEVARARQGVILAEEHVHVASIRLATTLRLDAKVQLATTEREVRPITFIAPDTPAERLVETALAAHPDVLAAARRVAAADTEDDASHYGPFFPTLHAGVGGLDGGLGYDGSSFGGLRGREDYYVGLELHLTGLGIGEVARARETAARLRAEKVREDDVRETVIANVLEAREVVRSRSAAIEVAREELTAADEARKIARKRLEQGTGIAIDLLAAEEERTRAATHLVDAIVGYDAAEYELLARIGEPPRP
jgi:outer membrane protein TolC